MSRRIIFFAVLALIWGGSEAQADSIESLLGGEEVSRDSGADFPEAGDDGSIDDESGTTPETNPLVESLAPPPAPSESEPIGTVTNLAGDDDTSFEIEGAEPSLVDLTNDDSPADVVLDEVIVGASPPAADAPLGPVGYDEEGQQGRIHVVASGDTLWDISENYLGTPWVWPSIWESNPDVANPHRIYPKDRIWITPNKMKRVTEEEAEALLSRVPEAPFEEYAELPPAAVDEVFDATPTTPRLSTFTFPRLSDSGYVSSEAYAGSGAIVDSPSPHTYLAQTRRVYLNLGEGEVSVGDRFDVVRATEKVRDPKSGRNYGVLVDRLGWLEVVRTRAESSEAIIRMSFAEMERGDRILPPETFASELPYRMNSGEIEGSVVFFEQSRSSMAQGDLVFLNRGAEDGLEVGNPLEVFRDKGRARDPMTKAKVTLPEDIVAGMIVISSEPETSVAVVTHSREEIEIGDTFRTPAN